MAEFSCVLMEMRFAGDAGDAQWDGKIVVDKTL